MFGQAAKSHRATALSASHSRNLARASSCTSVCMSRDETNEGGSAPAVISPSKIFWQSRESAHHTFKNEKCVASLVAGNYHIFVQHFRHKNTVPSLKGCPKLTPRPFGHDKFNLGGRRQQRINTYNKHLPLWWNQHCRIIGRQTLNTPAT